MNIHRSDGDGNCLFHSCAFFLNVDHQKLRQMVASMIREYPDLPINNKPLSEWLEEGGYGLEYADHVMRNGFDGSALEITLISIMFRRTIYILKYNPKYPGGYERIAEYFPHFGNKFYILWSGNHYDSIVD